MSNPAASFEPYRRRLLGLAYRMLGSMADAEDAVQETYLRWHGANRDRVWTKKYRIAQLRPGLEIALLADLPVLVVSRELRQGYSRLRERLASDDVTSITVFLRPSRDNRLCRASLRGGKYGQQSSRCDRQYWTASVGG
jgi:hypothetical protein